MDWAPIGRVASRQHGIITRAQLLAEGMTRSHVELAIAQGRLIVVHSATYRVVGSPDTPLGRTMAAVLAAGAGAAASHASAAWLWGLVPEPPPRPEVSVELPRFARLHGVVVHRTGDLAPRWIRTRNGIPATDPLHTMLVLGSRLPRAEVADALERGVMSGRFSVPALEWVRAELAERGRNGCGVLRQILDDRALGAARPDGMLEPRLAQLCARYGLERPVFQFRVTDGRGRVVAKVDFAYPDVHAFLEVDGFEVHGTPDAMEADFDRQNRLVALGWVPIRFGWRHLIRRPGQVAQQITSVLAHLRAG
jgi:very-short-patch-repair endonuclease